MNLPAALVFRLGGRLLVLPGSSTNFALKNIAHLLPLIAFAVDTSSETRKAGMVHLVSHDHA